MSKTCVMTGCGLRLQTMSEHTAWGDLYLWRKTFFVFHANMEGADVKWYQCSQIGNPAGARFVLLPRSIDYFEERGVFVWARGDSVMSTEAGAYLKRTMVGLT